MSSNVNWSNPYAKRDGQWYKGNLHTHTRPASGCGQIPVEDCINRYVELGYDFLALSDHMAYNNHKDPRMAMIPGVEWNAPNGYHTGVVSLSSADVKKAIGISDQEELLAALADTGALVILNHPNWQLRSHYRREELEARTSFDGIEIYNGVIERLQGYAISTDKWDYLLAKGIKCLGFSCDDSHRDEDIGFASMYVRAKSCTPANILRAMKAGNFYCSSGAQINDIRMTRGVIEIETPDAQEIHVRADGGKLIHRVFDKSIRFNTRDFGVEYVRFAVFGQGASMAWTQPFFLKRA